MSFHHSNVIPSFRNHYMSCKTEILWSVIPGSFLAGMTLEWHIYQFEVIPRWNDLEWQLPSSHWNDRDGLGMTGLGPEWRDEEASEEVIRISIPVILAPSRHSGVIRECSFNGDEPRMTAGWVRARDQSWLLSLVETNMAINEIPLPAMLPRIHFPLLQPTKVVSNSCLA